jgi:hypothetical protein
MSIVELKDVHRQKPPANGSLDDWEGGMPGTHRRKIQQTCRRQDPFCTGVLRHETFQGIDPAGKPTRTVGVFAVDEPLSKNLREGVEVCLLLCG